MPRAGPNRRTYRPLGRLSYAEAAEVCDCPIGTIRSRVARAREDLVAAMSDRGDRGSRSDCDGRSDRVTRSPGRDARAG